jgi:hypothetical protein
MGCGVRKYCLYSRGDTFALHGSNSFQIHQKENGEGKREYSPKKVMLVFICLKKKTQHMPCCIKQGVQR